MSDTGLPRLRRRYPRPLYLVTGADWTHGRSLVQLLRTIAIYEIHLRVVVYDLGLTDEQRDAVYDALGNGSVERFPYEAYPDFFDIRVEAGQYAWKPVIIAREMAKSSSPICWMDSGNILIGRLHALRALVDRDGYYLPRSMGTVGDWTHPGMLSALDIPPGRLDKLTNLNGACAAFDPMRPAARELVEQWAAYANRREVIAPPGADRSNHRQDQALLTVLAYKLGVLTQPSMRIDDYRTHRDVEKIKSTKQRPN